MNNKDIASHICLTTFFHNGKYARIPALRVAVTVAAPPISPLILSILPEGLMEIPPVSKVTPLPTRTTGAAP